MKSDPDAFECDRLAVLASDLELLGILGDPRRGPVACYYLPAQSSDRALEEPSGAGWRRVLTPDGAAFARIRLIVAARRLPSRTRWAFPSHWPAAPHSRRPT